MLGPIEYQQLELLGENKYHLYLYCLWIDSFYKTIIIGYVNGICLLIVLSVALPEDVPLVCSSSEDPLEVWVSINFGMFRHEDTRSTGVT